MQLGWEVGEGKSSDSWELASHSQLGHGILLLNKDGCIEQVHQTRPLCDVTDEDKNKTLSQDDENNTPQT